MATGLQTFDRFGWASLLAGRSMLVVDRDAARGRERAEALEEAGAVVTLAPGQAIGADRLKGTRFRHVVLGLSGGEAVAPALAPSVGQDDVILADASRREGLRSAFPLAKIGDHALDARGLVLFVTGTSDD